MWISSVALLPMMCTPSSRSDVGIEEQLEHAGLVAEDLALGELAVAARCPTSYGMRAVVSCSSVSPDHRDLGNRVDAVRQRATACRASASPNMCSAASASLLHRRRRQRREADHVAGGVDVRHRRLEVLVDLDAAARVGLEPGRLEVELIRVRPGGRPRRAARRRARSCRSRASPRRAAASRRHVGHLLAEAEHRCPGGADGS